MKTILVIYNSKSGNDNKEHLVSKLKHFFLNHGFSEENIHFIEPESANQVFNIAKEASLKKTDLIVSMGGDGTINKVAGGIYAGGSHSVLGILPSGSVNNFAKALAIPQDTDAAMANLISGRPKAIDICQVNQDTMISSLTLGFLADIAAGVTSKDKRRLGKLAFFKDVWRVLKRNRAYKLSLFYQGEVHQIRTKILLVTLTHSVAGMTGFNPKAKVDDGLLCCYYIDKLKLWQILLNLRQIRRGQFDKLSDISYFETDHLTIKNRSRRHNPVTRLDGDSSSQLPVTLSVIPQAINVMVPYQD